MNKLSVFGIYMFFGFGAFAQTVDVSDQNEQIGDEKVQGFEIVLDAKREAVAPAWIKYLKPAGKVRDGDHITVIDPALDGTTFSKKVIHSIVNENAGKTSVWIGIKKSDWAGEDLARVNNELKKNLKDFGVKYFKDRIQERINESQQAFDAVGRQKQRLINQGTDLGFSLANNEKQRLSLEKAIETNKLENADLMRRIAENKKAQDSLSNAGGQIQKVKATHEDRLKKVQ